MQQDFNGSYVQFIRAQSAATRAHLLALPWSDAQAARYAAMALDSLAEQQRIEAADTLPFEQYRQAYLSPERLQPRRVPAAAPLPGATV
jgi:glutamate--cysteine ligase